MHHVRSTANVNHPLGTGGVEKNMVINKVSWKKKKIKNPFFYSGRIFLGFKNFFPFFSIKTFWFVFFLLGRVYHLDSTTPLLCVSSHLEKSRSEFNFGK
jgi:hypothetical protein